MDVEELKNKILAGEIPIDQEINVIDTGLLKNKSECTFDYEIQHGKSLVSSIRCDREWGEFSLNLYAQIKEANYSEEVLKDVLGSIQNEDDHWEWFNKSMCLNSEEYEWFFLYTEGKPQGVCLIYHPKKSALNGDNIFYIEFIAVAPWNRDSKVHERYFHGVGSVLIKSVLTFAVNDLALTPGFSLHSLPQAQAYYQKLKMVNLDDEDKGSLIYFELPKEEADKLLGVA